MVLCRLMHGFLENRQKAAMATNKLTMKLSKHLCLECSTCAMFLSSSFTVSIMALFLSKSLSETLIKAPFMLLFNLVISCIPSTKSLWKRFLPMYPLSPNSLPYIKSMNALYSKGLRSLEKPLYFDPFGQTGLLTLAII